MMNPIIFMYPGRDLRVYTGQPTVESYYRRLVARESFMNYHDYEVNGEYNRQRIKAEIEHIRQENRALKSAKAATRQTIQITGALFAMLVGIEKSILHHLSVLLHVHPRPAAIHIRRRH